MRYLRRLGSQLAVGGVVALALGAGLLATAAMQGVGPTAAFAAAYPAKATTTTAAPTTTNATTTTTKATTTTTASTTTSTSGTSTTSTTSPTSTTTSTTQASVQLTGPYELYCPGTPVGNVVLNGATTSATITPANPTPGEQFNLTDYQTLVNLPQSLAAAAQAIQPQLEGSATGQVDATGATPSKASVGPFNFDVTIPTPVPASGVGLSLPSSPETVGPFTATSSGITIQEDTKSGLTLEIGGTPLNLVCTTYPNNTIATSGITTTAPSGSTIDPVIAVAGGGATTTTTTPPTTSSVPPTTTVTVTTSPETLAYTGPSLMTQWMTIAGGILVMIGVGFFILVDAHRRVWTRFTDLLRRARHPR